MARSSYRKQGHYAPKPCPPWLLFCLVGAWVQIMNSYISLARALAKLREYDQNFQMVDFYQLYLSNQIDICFFINSSGFVVSDNFDSNFNISEWENTQTKVVQIGGYFSAIGWHGYNEVIKSLLFDNAEEIYSRYGLVMNEEAKRTNIVIMPFEYSTSWKIPDEIKPTDLPKSIIKGAKLTKDTILIPQHQINTLCNENTPSIDELNQNTDLPDKKEPKLHHKTKSSYLKMINFLLERHEYNISEPYRLYEEVAIIAQTKGIDFINKDTFSKIVKETTEYRSK